MTAGALYGARRTPRQSLGIAFGSSRNLGGQVHGSRITWRRQERTGKEEKLRVWQCNVSLCRALLSPAFHEERNRASHTKSLLKHRRQPDALNDSRGVIRRSPNPAPKSRYCLWLFTESWGKSMAAVDSMASPRGNGQRREIACLAVQCVSLPHLASSSFP